MPLPAAILGAGRWPVFLPFAGALLNNKTACCPGSHERQVQRNGLAAKRVLTFRKNARTELITNMDEMTRFTIQVNGWNYPAKYWVRDHILHVIAATGTRAMPVEGAEPPALLAEKLLRQIIKETFPT